MYSNSVPILGNIRFKTYHIKLSENNFQNVKYAIFAVINNLK